MNKLGFEKLLQVENCHMLKRWKSKFIKIFQNIYYEHGLDIRGNGCNSTLDYFNLTWSLSVGRVSLILYLIYNTFLFIKNGNSKLSKEFNTLRTSN